MLSHQLQMNKTEMKRIIVTSQYTFTKNGFLIVVWFWGFVLLNIFTVSIQNLQNWEVMGCVEKVCWVWTFLLCYPHSSHNTVPFLRLNYCNPLNASCTMYFWDWFYSIILIAASKSKGRAFSAIQNKWAIPRPTELQYWVCTNYPRLLSAGWTGVVSVLGDKALVGAPPLFHCCMVQWSG